MIDTVRLLRINLFAYLAIGDTLSQRAKIVIAIAKYTTKKSNYARNAMNSLSRLALNAKVKCRQAMAMFALIVQDEPCSLISFD
ncbi:hypothetical protein AC062_0920 [Pasteurellaceae bacterium NI1060]|nr:hypothetical protein AC062_0920 [Pasteurellaceae bacterium NI1060]